MDLIIIAAPSAALICWNTATIHYSYINSCLCNDYEIIDLSSSVAQPLHPQLDADSDDDVD